MAGYYWNTTNSGGGLTIWPSRVDRYRYGTYYATYPTNIAVIANHSRRTRDVSGYTEGYHGKVADGKLVPFVQLHRTTQSFSQTPGSYTGEHWRYLSYPCATDYRVGSGNCYGVKTITVQADEPTSDHVNACLQEAAAKASEGAMQVLVEYAERAKTIELVRSAVGTVRKRTYQVLRKTKGKYPRLSKAEDIRRAFNDTWLEARYGWSQLVYSTEDLVQAYKELTSENPTKIVIGKSAQTEHAPGTITHFETTHTYYSNALSSRDRDVTLINSKTTRAVVAVRVHGRHGVAIDTNLAALAWEITPFSFVVDWFTNFGDLLRAHWPYPHVGERACAYSVKREVSVQFRIEGWTSPGCSSQNRYSSDTSCEGRAAHESYDRIPWTGDIPLSLTWRPRLGWKKCVDLIALIPGQRNIASLYRKLRV
jgi:hypothetical protein